MRNAAKAINEDLKITLKQRKFLKYYLESGNASDAARKAGYKNDVSGRENIQKPTIQHAFQKLMDQKGLSDGMLLDVLAAGLRAKKGDSELPDQAVRKGYLEIALKLKERTHDAVAGNDPGSLVRIFLPEKTPLSELIDPDSITAA